jgi:hypothetical protein
MNPRISLRNAFLILVAAAGVNIPVEALIFACGNNTSRELAYFVILRMTESNAHHDGHYSARLRSLD